MHPSHILLGVLAAAIWGFNILFVKLGVNELPPLLFCGLRFLLVSVPMVFLIPKPSIPFRLLLQYGLVTFALQFGLMMLAFHTDIPAGLSSLILQVQVFFSLLLAVLVLHERLENVQTIAMTICFLGLIMVWTHLSGKASTIGFLLEIGYAIAAAISHVIIKKMPTVEPIRLIVWGNLVSILPLLFLSCCFEGLPLINYSIQNMSSLGIAALTYSAYFSTWMGYSIWNSLLKKYPLSSIVPFLLLVPVFGMFSASVWLEELIPQWMIWASLLIILGLALHFWAASISYFLNRTFKIWYENN